MPQWTHPLARALMQPRSLQAACLGSSARTVSAAWLLAVLQAGAHLLLGNIHVLLDVMTHRRLLGFHTISSEHMSTSTKFCSSREACVVRQEHEWYALAMRAWHCQRMEGCS
jgi:hypothetical protein